MWIVLDGSFLTTTIWWLALWKPSFLWFPIYSSAAMKNNFSLKDFCANKKQKTKKPTQTPGTMTLPVVVASLACLLSFNHFWSKPCSCVCFEIKSWLNDCRVRSRSVAKCKILNVVFPLKKKNNTKNLYFIYVWMPRLGQLLLYINRIRILLPPLGSQSTWGVRVWHAMEKHSNCSYPQSQGIS